METFNKLFGSLLSLACHSFDRMVILACLPLLPRPANVVHLLSEGAPQTVDLPARATPNRIANLTHCEDSSQRQ